MSDDALTGGNEHIRVDETAYLGIVIPALQVVQAGIKDRELAMERDNTFYTPPYFSFG